MTKKQEQWHSDFSFDLYRLGFHNFARLKKLQIDVFTPAGRTAWKRHYSENKSGAPNISTELKDFLKTFKA